MRKLFYFKTEYRWKKLEFSLTKENDDDARIEQQSRKVNETQKIPKTEFLFYLLLVLSRFYSLK